MGHLATGPTCGPRWILSPALKHRGPPKWQGLCSDWAYMWATSDFVPRLEVSGSLADGRVYVATGPTCGAPVILLPFRLIGDAPSR